LKLSSKSLYAVRALLNMAYHAPAEPLKIDTISKKAAVPARFLEQIFQDLKKAGIIGSKRGPKGGYFLTQPPEQVTLASIIRAMEGDPRQSFCREEVPAEGDEPTCASVTSAAWAGVADQIEAVLEGVTLAELVRRGEAMGVPRDGYRKFTYII
jgi:Rrf2 family transcriptional regulator, iron-sulfur cluster assembly transcription factor